MRKNLSRSLDRHFICAFAFFCAFLTNAEAVVSTPLSLQARCISLLFKMRSVIHNTSILKTESRTAMEALEEIEANWNLKSENEKNTNTPSSHFLYKSDDQPNKKAQRKIISYLKRLHEDADIENSVSHEGIYFFAKSLKGNRAIEFVRDLDEAGKTIEKERKEISGRAKIGVRAMWLASLAATIGVPFLPIDPSYQFQWTLSLATAVAGLSKFSIPSDREFKINDIFFSIGNEKVSMKPKFAIISFDTELIQKTLIGDRFESQGHYQAYTAQIFSEILPHLTYEISRNLTHLSEPGKAEEFRKIPVHMDLIWSAPDNKNGSLVVVFRGFIPQTRNIYPKGGRWKDIFKKKIAPAFAAIDR